MAVLDITEPQESVLRDSPPVRRLGVPRLTKKPAPTYVLDSADRSMARELEVSVRSLEAARGMLVEHLGAAGGGQAGSLEVAVSGPRPMRLGVKGLFAATADQRAAVAVLADPLVIVVIGGPRGALHWSLLSGGPSVTARADALSLLRALEAGGSLSFRLGSGPALPPLVMDPANTFDVIDEWRLFEDLATLSEWSGVEMEVPTAVSPEEATKASQAASWIRTERVPARSTGPLSFEVPVGVDLDEVNELRLHEDLGIQVLGTEVPLGTMSIRLPVGRVERATSVRARAWPEQTDVVWTLSPPSSRVLPPRRTQGSQDIDAKGALSSERPSYVRVAEGHLDAEMLARIRRRPTVTAPNTTALLDDLRGH